MIERGGVHAGCRHSGVSFLALLTTSETGTVSKSGHSYGCRRGAKRKCIPHRNDFPSVSPTPSAGEKWFEGLHQSEPVTGCEDNAQEHQLNWCNNAISTAAENWTEKGAHSGAKGAENGAKQLAFSGLQMARDCTSVPEKENAGTIDNIRRSGVVSCKLSGEDRTPIELFIAVVRGWKADVRRQVE
jgi:hypothetical protein